MLACLRYTDEKSTLMTVAGFEISIFTISGRQNHLSKMTSAGFEANIGLLCRVVDCSCLLDAPVCVLVLVPVAHFSAMTKILDVLRRVRVKVSENTIPNIKAEVWKESAEGLHEVREDDDGNGDSLPLARNLDVNMGEAEGWLQALKSVCIHPAADNPLKNKGGLLPRNFGGASLTTTFRRNLYVSLGRGFWIPPGNGSRGRAGGGEGAS